MTEMDKYLYMRNMMFTALKTIQFEYIDGKKIYHIGLEICRVYISFLLIKQMPRNNISLLSYTTPQTYLNMCVIKFCKELQLKLQCIITMTIFIKEYFLNTQVSYTKKRRTM